MPMDPAICAMLSAAAIGSGTFVVSQLSESETKYYWDPLNHYVTFDSEYNHIITDILSNRNGKYTKLGRIKMVGGGKAIPEKGSSHYYFSHPIRDHTWFNFKSMEYVGLEKVEEETSSGNIKTYYLAWYLPLDITKRAFNLLVRDIMVTQENEIRVIHIDTSKMDPQLLWLTKTCHPPRNHQRDVVDTILNRWGRQCDFNIKVIIHGKRGVGKTYTSKLVKKQLDKINGVNCRLYHNFDPSAIGVDINVLALSTATAASPVILTINEIDTVYESVITPSQNFDPRIQHTRSIQKFHDMLDDIASVKYVISIFTTEKTIEELRSTQQFLSFMRKGRVDMFISMTEDSFNAEYL